MALRLIRQRSRLRMAGDPDPPDHLRRRTGSDRAHAAESEALPHRGIRSHRAWIMLGLVLVMAVVALLAIERATGPPVPTLPAQPLEGEPDIYMESAIVSQYREDGSLEYRLETVRASHFQGEAITRLTEPRLTLLHHERPPWIITAREGILSRPAMDPESETVVLEGDVVLSQTREDGDEVRLLTDALDLYPRREYAETDQGVMIESRFGRTTASGLKGNLRLGMLELLSAHDRPVQTTLQPEHFK